MNRRTAGDIYGYKGSSKRFGLIGNPAPVSSGQVLSIPLGRGHMNKELPIRHFRDDELALSICNCIWKFRPLYPDGIFKRFIIGFRTVWRIIDLARRDRRHVDS